MIRSSELREIYPIYCYAPKGDTVTFASLKNLIGKTAKVHGIPVAFELNEITSRKSNEITVEDCLVVYHPKHRQDYINIVFRIRREADIAYISKNEYGTSPRMKSTNMFDEASKLRNPLRKVIEDDKELEAEKRYYLALHAVFNFLKC